MDAICKFLFFSAIHVGGTNDAVALETCPMRDMTFLLQLAGDAAYTLASFMMVPYWSTNLHLTDPDSLLIGQLMSSSGQNVLSETIRGTIALNDLYHSCNMQWKVYRGGSGKSVLVLDTIVQTD